MINSCALALTSAPNAKRSKDFEFQPVKARKADLKDARPGVAVSNTDAKFRDAELAIIQNSGYRIRCHRER